MSKMIGGGSDRMNLIPLDPDGNRDGNDDPALDHMIGCHTGTSYGLNFLNVQPGTVIVWERNKGPDIMAAKRRGGVPIQKGDPEYPASSVVGDGLEATALDSAEIYNDLIPFRYPEEAIRQRREQEAAKSKDQLRSGAAEFVSQATPAEVAFSGGSPSRFAGRKHRLDYRAGYSSESPMVDQWTPEKGIVDDS